MRTRPLAFALLLTLAPATLGTAAWAEGSAEDPTTDMARARFKEGVGFYDKGQFEQARAAFLQAYALKKHPAVLLNLAWSSLKSGHVLEAQHYFKQFLTEGKDITDKQRADANDGLNQANAKLGRVEVVAATGTEVTVDGEKAGTVPLPDAIMVEPGAHTVKFKGPDGATDTDSVTVLAGEKAVARFAKTASATPAAATNPPPPAESPAPAESPTPTAESAPKPEAPKEEASGSHKSILSAPSNVVPVVIGGVLVAASVGVAIAMAIVKNSAQTKATDTANQIMAVGGTSCNPPAPSGAIAQTITKACAQFVSDNNDVNTDATVGNLAVGVGVVAAVGTVVYWLLADKRDDSSPTSASLPALAPIVGPTSGGLTLSGRF